MVEHPILFAGPLVGALLAGQKSQSRRLVISVNGHEAETIRNVRSWERSEDGLWKMSLANGGGQGTIQCPWGVPGHRLWVRETHAFIDIATGYETKKAQKKYHRPEKHLSPVYRVGASDFEESLISRWRPSLHMPRWAARIFLDVTDIRIERLWSITEEDAKAEGVIPFHEHFPCIGRDQFIIGTGERCADFPYRASFAVLWDELSDEGPLWKDNPWVWALSFRMAEAGVVAAE